MHILIFKFKRKSKIIITAPPVNVEHPRKIKPQECQVFDVENVRLISAESTCKLNMNLDNIYKIIMQGATIVNQL